jgi:hypothetical protein
MEAVEMTLATLHIKILNPFYSLFYIKDLGDNSFIKENEIKLIFIPEIITQSSSSSAFTWPPTKFVIDLTVKALNTNGEIVWEKNIKKTGEAEYDEFKEDFSLSARRAVEHAFIQLAKDIEQEPLIN